MVYPFGEHLYSVEMDEWEASPVPAVFLTNSSQAPSVFEKLNITYEADMQLSKIGFCKIENQQDGLVGTFCIPKLLDVLGSRYKIAIFINDRHIVIVDDEDFSLRLIRRIQQKKMHQGETRERFIYNYIAEFISRDQELLLLMRRNCLRWRKM